MIRLFNIAIPPQAGTYACKLISKERFAEVLRAEWPKGTYMSSKTGHLFRKMGIRERIIYALEQSKKTRQALADELGVGRGAVSDMLNKEGEFDSIKYLEACERITGFRFEWLRTGKGPEKHSEEKAEREEELNVDIIEDISGIRVPVNRDNSELQDGDVILAMRLKKRIVDKSKVIAGKGILDAIISDFEFFEIEYKAN